MFLPLIFRLLLLQISVAAACPQPGSNAPVSFVKFRMVLPVLLLPLPVFPIRTMRSSSGSSSSSEKVRVQTCLIICCTLIAIILFTCNVHIAYLSLAGAATVYLSSRQSFDPPPQKKCLLSRQNSACCDKPFVATNLFFLVTQSTSRQLFVAANIILLRQAYFCRDNTRLLSRQRYACRDKRFGHTSVFVHTNVLSLQTRVCCNK